MAVDQQDPRAGVAEPVDDLGLTDEDKPLTFAASVLVNNDQPGPPAPQGTVDDEQQQTRTLTSTDDFSTEGGTVSWSTSSGLVTYTPPENFNGTDTFTYRVQDNGRTGGVSDPRDAAGTVTVTVLAVNDDRPERGTSVLGEHVECGIEVVVEDRLWRHRQARLNRHRSSTTTEQATPDP